MFNKRKDLSIFIIIVGLINFIYFLLQNGIVKIQMFIDNYFYNFYNNKYYNFINVYLIVLVVLNIILVAIIIIVIKIKIKKILGIVLLSTIINLFTLIAFGVTTIFSVAIILCGIIMLLTKDNY